MNEELKPCPFCGGEATTTKKGPIRNQWWEVVCVSGECDTASITGDTKEKAIAAWNTRADLLPVVNPLEWEETHSGVWRAKYRTGHFYECFNVGADTWVVYETIHGTGKQIGDIWPDLEAALAAAQADYEARIRASLDMIDSAALVAGAYEAAADELAKMARSEEEIDNPHDAELLGFMSRHIKTLTPANAQAALDAAIAKAVNAKLEEAAQAVAPMTIKIAGTPYQAGCGQIAETILAMKEIE